MKSHKIYNTSKYRYLIFILSLLIVIVSSYVYSIFTIRYADTPREIISRTTNSPVLQVVHILKEVEVDNNEILVIYINAKGNISFGLVEKTNRGYKLIHASGEIKNTHKEYPIDLRFSYYNKEKGWIGYGIIHDDNVSKIIIDNQEANIVKMDKMRMWYLVGKRYLDESNIIILDNKGNKLEY